MSVTHEEHLHRPFKGYLLSTVGWSAIGNFYPLEREEEATMLARQKREEEGWRGGVRQELDAIDRLVLAVVDERARENAYSPCSGTLSYKYLRASTATLARTPLRRLASSRALCSMSR